MVYAFVLIISFQSYDCLPFSFDQRQTSKSSLTLLEVELELPAVLDNLMEIFFSALHLSSQLVVFPHQLGVQVYHLARQPPTRKVVGEDVYVELDVVLDEDPHCLLHHVGHVAWPSHLLETDEGATLMFKFIFFVVSC